VRFSLSPAGEGDRRSRPDEGRAHALPAIVVASVAKQSTVQPPNGLLRRSAPRNDSGCAPSPLAGEGGVAKQRRMRGRRASGYSVLSYDGTDSALGNVIPAKARIQTWRPLRPLPLDSRFRGNDNAGDSVKSRHALVERPSARQRAPSTSRKPLVSEVLPPSMVFDRRRRRAIGRRETPVFRRAMRAPLTAAKLRKVLLP